MKILHISKYHAPFSGGIENFVLDLSREQTRRGHTVRIICHAHERTDPTSRENTDGMEIVRVRTPMVAVHAPLSPSMGGIIKNEIIQFQPDVIHAHMPNLAPFHLLRFKNCPPVVVHWHADATGGAGDRRLDLLYPFYRPFERALLKKAHTVIATSPPYLESSPALRPFKDKCEVVPLGLDPLRNGPGPQFSRTDRTLPMVLSVGRFTFYKGFDLLVRAAAMVHHIEVVMAGGGRELPDVKFLARESGAAERITFPGRVSDSRLGQLLDECDILCLPSTNRAEAFGMVLLEGMSRGKPLISTSIPGSGTGWVNRDTITGLTVPPGDHEALAVALSRLADDTDLRAEMSRNCLQRFKDHFHIRAVTRSIDEVYETVSA